MDRDIKSVRKKVKRTESYKLATNRKHSIDDLDVIFVDRLVSLNNDRTRKRTQHHTSLPTRLKSTRPKSKPVQEMIDDDLPDNIIHERSRSAKPNTSERTFSQRSASAKSNSSDKTDKYRSASTKSHSSDKTYSQRSASSKSNSSDKTDTYRSASSKSNSSDKTDTYRSTSTKSHSSDKTDPQRSALSKSNSSDKTDTYRSASSKSNSSDKTDTYRSASAKSNSSGKTDRYRSTSTKSNSSDKADSQRSASSKLHSNDKTRSGSQKSGTVASSDTDDDRRSVSEIRKKKSVFRRMKERLIQTFRKSKLIEIDREAEDKTDFGENSNRNAGASEREFFLKADLAPKGKDSELVENHLNYNPTQAHNQSIPIDIEVTTGEAHNQQEEDLDNTEDNDTVSKIFDDLIDPETPFLRLNNRTGPDKSKLRLYGLETFRPKSFEEQHSINTDRDWTGQTNRGKIQSPKHSYVFSDAESTGMSDCSVHCDSDFHDLVYNNNQRKLYDFGRRFAAIADRLVDDRERGNRDITQENNDRTSFSIDNSLVSEQHAKQLSGKDLVKTSILPIITSLIAAREYREFHQIILKELSSTAHWEQVAWYTYLMKSTLSMVGKGRDLGRTVHRYAKQYFNWQLRPWIESRPNGWESIYEETDAEDSELD